MVRKTVVIVEDEALLALELESLCEDYGCRVLGRAASGEGARRTFASIEPDILITDMELADGSDGVSVAEMMLARLPRLELIFVTGTTEPRQLQRIAALAPKRVLRKPVRAAALREALFATSA